MTLDQIFRQNARVGLEIVNILREIREQLLLILEETNECMRWGELISLR